jgi:hypothetical protein
MYTTKITVEVEIVTQGGPASAIKALQCALDFPAVEQATVVGLTTDYRNATNLLDVENTAAVSVIPKTIVRR